ncbi:MAG TPA: hypothetical protein VKA70_09085 [Blastocatellia bacterium]|nr:hypothetical protein [Blastocatellia bacterium]
MLKRFFSILNLAAAALLALALGVGANSGIQSLSQFTPASNSPFCRESHHLAVRQLKVIKSSLPDAPQDESVETARPSDSAFQGFDLRKGQLWRKAF